MNASTMSEEFHDWLEQCPCQWNRISNDANEATYQFTEEESDE